MSTTEIMELKQKIAGLETAITGVQEENQIWEQIFLENSWGMAIADTSSGKMLRVNPCFAKMHGYSTSELIGKSLYDELCAPGHQKDLLEVGPRIHTDRYEYNSVHVRKDGSYFPVRTNNHEIIVNEQRLRIISTWDITKSELKEKELSQYRESLEELVKFRTEELEKTNNKLREEIIQKESAENRLAKANQEMINILESLGDYFEAVNREWIITYANKAMVKALKDNGMDDDNIVGTNFLETHKLGGKTITNACFKVMNDGIPIRFETYAAGIRQWVEVSIYPTESGISIFFRNIEERRKIEKAVEEEHHRLYLLFNSFPGLICLQEENYKIRFANESFKAKFGPYRDRLCFEVIGGSSVPCQDCMSDMVFRSHTAAWKEMVFDNRIYEVYSQPFIDADGTRLIFKVLMDVTDRRSADRELARLERLNILGEMAAGIAHEVRNPLTIVRGFLQLLQSKDETIKFHEFFQLMTDELDRANLILTDFLGLARDKTMNFELINITKIVTTLAPLLTADAINQDKKITLELEEVPDIYGNGNELRQLILNFARNGLEAMQAGTTLTIRTHQSENHVLLKVCDQGEGVGPEILEKLGTPFLTTKERGTGLGIAICQSIAARHNAVINFESDCSGTTVIVRFPIAHD